MNPILSKRETLRSKIRRDNLEIIFKQKRILQSTLNSQYYEIHLQLSDNVEKESYQLIQNQNLIMELINSNDEIALLILANSCASEQQNVINCLVQDYKIHQYFMKKIQQTKGDLTSITFKCYSGLSNLLYSQPKLVQIVREHLFQEKILQIVYQSVNEIDQNDKKDWIASILRLIIGLLSHVQSTQISQQQYLIGIVEIVFKWIDINRDLSIYVLRLSTYICNELLEYLNEETFDKILLKILNTEDDKPDMYIKLIDDLFTTSNEKLVINYLDNTKLDEVIQFAVTSRDVALMGAALNFLYNRVVNKNQSIQEFVYQFYKEIIYISKISSNQGLIEKCLLILQELHENEQLNDHVESLYDYLFQIIKDRIIFFDFQNCVEAAKLLHQLQIQNQLQFNDQQLNVLDILNHSKSEDLSDLAKQILSINS